LDVSVLEANILDNFAACFDIESAELKITCAPTADLKGSIEAGVVLVLCNS
jgi:hypothetical protein